MFSDMSNKIPYKRWYYWETSGNYECIYLQRHLTNDWCVLFALYSSAICKVVGSIHAWHNERRGIWGLPKPVKARKSPDDLTNVGAA